MPYKDATLRRAKQREATARWRAKNPEANKASEQLSNANRKNEQREWRDERRFRFRFGPTNPHKKSSGLFTVGIGRLQNPVFKVVGLGRPRIEVWSALQKVMGCPLSEQVEVSPQ